MRLIDSAGRAWDNGRYIRMYFDTLAMRAYNDLAEMAIRRSGMTLARIEGGNERSCKACKRWERRIVNLGEGGAGYPTVQDAKADGVFHPNCIHYLVHVNGGGRRKPSAREHGSARIPKGMIRSAATTRPDTGAIAEKKERINARRTNPHKSTMKKLKRLIDMALNYEIDKQTKRPKKLKPERADFGLVPSKLSSDINRIYGVDVSQYNLFFRTHEIRHIDRRHGAPRVIRVFKNGRWKKKNAGEQDATQIPLLEDDISRLAEIPFGYDGISGSEKDGKKYCILTSKDGNDETELLVEIVESERFVSIKTGYKRRGA